MGIRSRCIRPCFGAVPQTLKPLRAMKTRLLLKVALVATFIAPPPHGNRAGRGFGERAGG